MRQCLIACLLFAQPLLAMAQGGDTVPPAPTTSFVFQEVVTLDPTQDIGATPAGERHRVPITGGIVSGRISGRVVPGGADWQLVRPDKSLVVDADYMIETDDHVLIHVHNVGVLQFSEKGALIYGATAPQFEAPLGKYGWLNDTLFVGKLASAGDKEHPGVRVIIYKVD